MCDNNCHECNECRPPTSNQTAALAYIKGKDALGCNKYDGVVSVVQDGVQGLPTGNVINEGDTISIIGADGLQHLVTLPISGVQTEIIDCSDVATCQVILNLITADAVLATRIEDLEDTFCTRVAACIDATLCSRVQTCMQPIIDTLTSRLNTAETDIDALQAFVANICANIATCLVPINTTLTDLVDNFCTKVAACSVVVNLQNAVTALTTRVTNAEATLAAHQAFIDNICTNIASCLVPLTTRVTDVEQDLATIYVDTVRVTTAGINNDVLNPAVGDIISNPYSTTITNTETVPIVVNFDTFYKHIIQFGTNVNTSWQSYVTVDLRFSSDNGVTWSSIAIPTHTAAMQNSGFIGDTWTYTRSRPSVTIPVGGSITVLMQQQIESLDYQGLAVPTIDFQNVNCELTWWYSILRHV